MILGHTIALDPTTKQANALARAAGVARFTYNWALAEWNRQYYAGEKPTAAKLKKQFNAIKGEAFPWVCESPRDANSQAFADLGKAFHAFFVALKSKRRRRVGYPTRRRKGLDDAFYVANDKFRFHKDNKRVYLPVIGSVRIQEHPRFEGKLINGRIRRRAGRWYLSIQVEGAFTRPVFEDRHPVVGIDLGLKTAVVPSHGEPLSAPKPLHAALQRLRRANRALRRRKKGGSNRFKARCRVARIHQRIANIRHDFMHKATTKLCRENQAVVIEDLNVVGMLRNKRLARAVSDVGLGLFRRFMEYKAPLYGVTLITANRWFASSKRCHQCGNVRSTLALSERIYACDVCGLIEDRDRNAAKNLEAYPGLLGNAPQGRTPRETSTSV